MISSFNGHQHADYVPHSSSQYAASQGYGFSPHHDSTMHYSYRHPAEEMDNIHYDSPDLLVSPHVHEVQGSPSI